MIRGHIPDNHGRGQNRKSRNDRRKRQEMFNEQKGLCFWCKEKMQMNPLVTSEAGAIKANKRFATFEHLIPKSEGGTSAKSNLVLAHAKCNNRRVYRNWSHDPFYCIKENRDKVIDPARERQRKENKLKAEKNERRVQEVDVGRRESQYNIVGNTPDVLGVD